MAIRVFQFIIRDSTHKTQKHRPTVLAHAFPRVYRWLLTDATVFDTTQVFRLKAEVGC
jgi:hypothetical protein